MPRPIFSRPHFTAAALGAALMLITVTAISISYRRMLALHDVAAMAIYEYHPAQNELLFIDRDLYQAQLALERGAALADPLDRKGQLTIFNENVEQTSTRFISYRERTAHVADQTGAVASYLGYRDDWLVVARLLAEQIAEGEPGPQIASTVLRSADAFGEMRFALDRITSSIIEPAIQATSQELANEAALASDQLVVTLIIALLVGTVVTVTGSSTIRRQHDQMLLDQDRQKSETKRKELEKRIRNAFELVQTEAAAIDVARGVLSDVIGKTHHTELLLADTSFAHLHCAMTTESDERNGCKVLRPSDCPAIRRNLRLSFPSSRSFDACPFLKERSDEGCSAICVPLSVLGRTAGVLHVVGETEVLPNAEQELALRALAMQSGDVLGVLRVLATKDRQANTDSLTGLDNRRSLESKFPAIVARGRYAVAFGDLDLFKKLNDTHGHDIGDRAIRLFADVLRASLRPDDLAGRWGGEEFVIVLPGAIGGKAVRVLERIRANLRENLTLGTVPSFTVSFGVCDSRDAESVSDVLNAADAALLRAKSEGRDRIVYGRVENTDDGAAEITQQSGAASSVMPRRAKTA